MKEFEIIKRYIQRGESDMYDVTEVGKLVRCKDCKHCITHEKILFCGYMGNIGDWRYRTETDYCSRGERKEVEND